MPKDALLFMLILLSLVSIQPVGGVTGLWDFRYDVVWSTTSEMLGSSLISMVQNGSAITGSASIDEPEPMDGHITGIYTTEGFEISAVMYRRHLLIISMKGSASDSGLLKGSFVAASSDGKAWRGNFMATLTNPDPEFLKQRVAPETRIEEQKEDATEEAAPKSRFFEIKYSRDETIYPRPVM